MREDILEGLQKEIYERSQKIPIDLAWDVIITLWQ